MNLLKFFLIALTLLIGALIMTKGNVQITSSSYPPANEHPITKQEDRRDYSNTLLTYPEWFLVFSPQEFSDLTKEKVASDFTYFGHVVQFWSAYYQIFQATKNDPKFNSEYHTMIMVIGVSTTVEYFFKGLYEFSVGKLSKMLFGRVPEDDFTHSFAYDYVEFIKITPWYEFDFYSQLKKLWATPWQVKGFLRQLERRYVLTTELLIKQGYGALIKKATKSSFESPKLFTVVAGDKKVEFTPAPESSGDLFLYQVPRYQPFQASATSLAKQGVEFKEVAGNNSQILISVLTTTEDKGSPYPIFLEQAVLTKPGMKRVLILVPISKLASFLVEKEATIEHVFDY